jgi:hypothetical protein
MIEYLFGVVVGSLITMFLFLAYVSFTLYQFGWTWKMIKTAIKTNEQRKQEAEDFLADYNNEMFWQQQNSR